MSLVESLANFHFLVNYSFTFMVMHSEIFLTEYNTNVFSEAVLACMNEYFKTSLILHT